MAHLLSILSYGTFLDSIRISEPKFSILSYGLFYGFLMLLIF